jgi:hypothetical protein
MVSSSADGPERARGARALGVVLAIGVVGFVALSALAAVAYPGGTYCEPAAERYRFLGNYFCDLTAPVTLRGADNRVSANLTRAAFACFALATAPFFWLLGGLSFRPSLVRALGLVAAFATLGLAWLPSRAGANLHASAVFGATIPGLVAAALGIAGAFRSPDRRRAVRLSAWLGAMTFVFAAADVAGYAHAVATDGGCVPWLPALQKLTALVLLSWMLAVAGAGSGGSIGVGAGPGEARE